MNIYLIRHTAVGVEKGTCYGQSDVQLASTFYEERLAIQKKLPQKLDVVYSSPLQRCKQLAEFLDGSCQTDDRLMELNFGEWELKRWNRINPEALQQWMENYVNSCCPGGESFLDLHKRATEFWNEILMKKAGNIVVVTHGGVIRSIIAQILAIPLNKIFAVDVDYGSITKLSYRDEHTYVRYLNR